MLFFVPSKYSHLAFIIGNAGLEIIEKGAVLERFAVVLALLSHLNVSFSVW